MKNKLRTIAATSGIFMTTVLITYAASSLIPTYAPGANPPDLDSAPLIYRMAGQTDPDSFDHANDSLKAIGEKLDSMDSKIDSGVGGLSAPVIISPGVAYPSDKNFCIASSSNYSLIYVNVGGVWSRGGMPDHFVSTTCGDQGENSTYGCHCF